MEPCADCAKPFTAATLRKYKGVCGRCCKKRLQAPGAPAPAPVAAQPEAKDGKGAARGGIRADSSSRSKSVVTVTVGGATSAPAGAPAASAAPAKGPNEEMRPLVLQHTLLSPEAKLVYKHLPGYADCVLADPNKLDAWLTAYRKMLRSSELIFGRVCPLVVIPAGEGREGIIAEDELDRQYRRYLHG